MNAIIWSKPGCSFCTAAKKLLNTRNVTVEERVIGDGWSKDQLLEAVPNARTVPQIFLDNEYVGGFDELKKRLL